MHLSSESFGNRRLTVYRIDESGEAEAIAEVTAENGEITFAATQDGVYAVAALDALITASDGNTYRITAEYEAAAGIPMEGTALSVREITEDDPDYAFYMEESMKAADTDRDHLAFARVRHQDR